MNGSPRGPGCSIRHPPDSGPMDKEDKTLGETGESGKLREVRAPMSGVFYRRPSPEDPPYVEVGDVVRKKQVLALLETMKVFQSVKSPVAGKILEIAAENETPLKDEDLMFIIEKA